MLRRLSSREKRYFVYLVIPLITLIILTILAINSYHALNQIDKKSEFIIEMLSASAAWVAAFLAYFGLISAAEGLLASNELIRFQETIKASSDLNADERLQAFKQFVFEQGEEMLEYFYCWAPLSGEESEVLTNLDYKKRRSDLFYSLNKYEFVAIAIKKRVMDEDLMKEMQKQNFIKFWNYAHKTIFSLRKNENKPTLFNEFEELAKKWSD
ncbi:MAG: DUF4760 domain-containing protein [Burkholderiaceae bacterium]